MRDAVAPQLIRHYLHGFAMVDLQQTFEKPLGSVTISASLWKHINHITILID